MVTARRALILIMFCITGAAAQDLSAIDFTLKDINGKDQSLQSILKSIRGDDAQPKKGALIISFWAMWCEPCKQEMKALRTVFEKYEQRNLHYLAINTDNPRSLAKVQSYIAAQKLPYLFLLDPNSEVFKKLNGQSMPYSLIVNEHGKLLAKRVGFIAGDEKGIEDDIQKALE